MNLKRHIIALLAVLVFSSFLSAKEVTIGYTNWEPFYGDNLPNKGAIFEIVNHSFTKAGYTTKAQLLPWSRATKKVADGEIDILISMYYTDQRTETYAFSEPLAYVNVGLISHTNLGISEFKSMRDLRPYSIGVNRNWVNSSEFDEAYYLKKDPAKNQKLTIRKLLHQRVDMIVVAQEIFKHEVVRMGHKFEDYTFIEPILSHPALHLASGKKNPRHKQIIDDFNRAFQTMIVDGSYSKIMQRHQLENASVINHKFLSTE